MNINTRSVCGKYLEITICYDEDTIDLGLCDKEDSVELLMELKEFCKDFEYEIEQMFGKIENTS
jgi:hypothetical protein